MDRSGGGRARGGVYRNPSLKVAARDVQMRPVPTPGPVFVPRVPIMTLPPPLAPVPTPRLPQDSRPHVAESSSVPPHARTEAPEHERRVPAVAEQSQQSPSSPSHHTHSVRAHHRKFHSKKASPPTQDQQSGKNKKRLTRSAKVLYAAAGLVLIVGVLLAYRAYSLNSAVDTQVKKLEAKSASSDSSDGSASTALPTDTKPADKNYLQNYKVAATLPRMLTISKIGVKARVMQVGVDKDNQMGVPTTAYDVAWYNGSSRPGEMGAMIIDGHVQGVGGGAIFTNLKKLAAGDKITLERGDGKVFTYSVTSVETVPVAQVDVGALLVSADTNKPGLNLITCGGKYNTASDSFDSRTIVHAIQQ